MTESLLSLIAAALGFVGGHFLFASVPVRAALVGRIGEALFRAFYSIVAAGTLFWMVAAYQDAPFVALWADTEWARTLLLVLMLLASILFVGSITAPNPSIAGMEDRAARVEPGKGAFAITRHPMLWSFALWALGHLLVNGDAASLVLFGSILVLALGGMVHIDARKRASDGEVWARVEAVTSLVPFAAIRQGRAKLRMADFGWWRIGVAVALYCAMLLLHGGVIGLSPYPA